MMILRFNPNQILLLLLVLSLTALAAAFAAEFALHLPPCILCLTQRVPFALAIVFSGIGLARIAWRKPVLWVLAALFLINVGVALFQVGEEQKWWGLNATGNSEVCTAPNMTVQNVQQLYESMSGTPMGDCAHPKFSWHSVTFAVINTALCLLLSALATYGATHAQRKKN